MAAEPIREQIIAALRTRLAGIVAGQSSATGWEYRDTPAAVLRHHEFSDACLDSSLAVVYVLIPDRTPRSNATSRERDGTIELDLVLAKQYRVATENPYETSEPNREQVQGRLAADAEARLTDDPSFTDYQGFGVSRIQIMSEDESAEATYYPGWALVILRVEVDYRYQAGHP
jgi:hypothetical protein